MWPEEEVEKSIVLKLRKPSNIPTDVSFQCLKWCSGIFCVCVCECEKTLVDAFMLIYLLLAFLLIRDQNCVFLIGISFWALKCIIIIVSAPQ